MPYLQVHIPRLSFIVNDKDACHSVRLLHVSKWTCNPTYSRPTPCV